LVHRCIEDAAAHSDDDADGCIAREKPRNRCLSVIDMSFDVVQLFW
jgi:hypothetical protein